MILVGSETQNLEAQWFVTGIQRVVREAHVAMTDALTPEGIRIGRLHTRPGARRTQFRGNSYLAADPVLDQAPVTPEEVDAFLFMDVHPRADFSLVHREKRRRRRPVISLVHDVLPLIHPEWWPDDPDRVFRMYLQQLLAVSDHVVVTSQKVRADLLSLGWRIPGEIHVLPLGSPFRPRRPEPPSDARLSLLYVSTVEPRKGHDLLVRAFDLLSATGYDIDLAIVGREGWSADHVITALREHPDFGGRLRWYTDADDFALTALARSSAIGVFPTLDEGFGLFLEEGLTFGLPMVVSDIPVFRERAQPNVHFADRTPEAFAEVIVRAHETPWVDGAHVRSAQDFGHDLSDLVRSVVQ